MKWTALAVRFFAALAVANAFAPPSTPAQRSLGTFHGLLSMVGEEVDEGEIDWFYDDEEEDDPSDMKVSDIKRELNVLKIDYSDCNERRQLEMRLRLVRENPSKYQKLIPKKPESKKKDTSSRRPQDGPTTFPQNGQIGMKSVETSFEHLKQNVQGTSKKEAFFGSVDGVVEVEGESTTIPELGDDGKPRPPSWTDGATLLNDLNQASKKFPQRSDSSANSKSAPEGLSFFADAIVESAPPAPENEPQAAEAIPDLEPPKKKPGNDRPRWSQFDGIKVEAPSGQGVHFDTAQDQYNRRLQVEQAKERNERESKRQVDGATMWDGIRVEPAGQTRTDDPFQGAKKQRPSHNNEQGGGTTTFFGQSEFGHNHIDLEPPSRNRNFQDNYIDLTTPTGQGGTHHETKTYKKANQQEKDKYSGHRDFRSDQQASSTTVFQGIMVEEVPGQQDIRSANKFKREEQAQGQGGWQKDFKYDPQRAEQTATFNGIQVECAPGEIPKEQPFQSAPHSVGGSVAQSANHSNKDSPSTSSPSTKTTTFEGVKNSAQDDLYSASSRSIPDDPFAPRTLEHPDPKPRRTSLNDVHHNPSTAYGGVFEKTVGGGSFSSSSNKEEDDGGSLPGSLDIDGRL